MRTSDSTRAGAFAASHQPSFDLKSFPLTSSITFMEKLESTFHALHDVFDHAFHPTHHVYSEAHTKGKNSCFDPLAEGASPPRTRSTNRLDDELNHFGTVIHDGLSASDDHVELAGGITFENVERDIFLRFRTTLGVSQAEYINSMSKLNGGKTEASGKSGSLFWFSEDKRYVLKSIADDELETLIDILPRYVAHFEDAASEGRLCLLTRFYGAYCISSGSKKIRLIAMNNCMGVGKPERAYDLKGTTEDRYVEEEDGKVMKDLNYEDTEVRLEAGMADSILEAVEADTAFLMQENIMDYSLLLGVFDPQTQKTPTDLAPTYKGSELCDDEVKPAEFRMGIIDILVRYSLKKKAAHWLKKPTLGLCCGEEIDTEPPDYYQERFAHSMTEKIV